MKRRDAREVAFRLTYEMVISGDYNDLTKDELMQNADRDSREYVETVTRGVQSHRNELKSVIVKYAKGYDFDRIYKTDLAILYLACYELLYTDTPHAVVANEAVELAKLYSDVKSHAFVNGVLASVIKERGDGE